MKFFLMTLLFISTNVFAYTLANPLRIGFNSGDVKVYIGSDNCVNANLSPTALESLVKDAINDYWNTVATSSLKIESLGVSSISSNGDTGLSTAAAKTAVNSIIVGCNNDLPEFSTPGVLGVGGNSCSGTNCRGVVIMNDAVGTYMATEDRATIVNALAHEMGHALGLGHTSVQEALMYFNLTINGKVQKSLHQDDIDGITYLYPNKKSLSGLGGACGTISLDDKERKNYWMSFLFGIACLVFFKARLRALRYL